ncbi:putative ankyrin repeat protein RF_0381 [Schistocerca americana]|uniref:putative ankyrin repeat protein RF_0381 n=1 Tax=Schistocerca americana TaxID=7009 RepID=UPI001F4FEA3D|nr:putative ankyrin repeat protein RF_0381 [Schistocerca americana]
MMKTCKMKVTEKDLTVEEVLQWTPLQFAEETNAWYWVDLLLQAGVPQQDLTITKTKLRNQESAAQIMRAACESGYVSLLNFALSVDPSLVEAMLDSYGSTALHVAASNRRNAAVRILLGAGTDVEATDLRGRTALHAAAENDAIASIHVLLEHGANICAKDCDGKTATLLAQECGHTAAANTLDLSGCMQWSMRKLIIAAEAGNVEAVRQILPAVKTVVKPGEWPHLHWATLNGSVTVVRTLLAAGLDPNGSDRHGNTALHVAAARGRPATTAALVDAGADLDAADSSGSTALHYAVRTDNVPVARLLLAAGAAPDPRDDQGQTPLHRAVARGSATAVAALLRAGASPDVADAAGRTPADLARQLGYKDVLRCLRLAPH